ncbi:protein of unknown function [Thauera humireducens]|nr:protein of unknown function [Thauera humireducens]
MHCTIGLRPGLIDFSAAFLLQSIRGRYTGLLVIGAGDMASVVKRGPCQYLAIIRRRGFRIPL